MKLVILAAALCLSTAAFAGGIEPSEQIITGPGYPAQVVTGQGTVDASENGIFVAPNPFGGCEQGYSQVLLTNAQGVRSVVCVAPAADESPIPYGG